MCVWGTETIVRVKVPGDLACEGVDTWKAMPIDACIAPLVSALQAAGVDMRGSCCGHGEGDGYIHLQDGRLLVIKLDGDAYYQSPEYRAGFKVPEGAA